MPRGEPVAAVGSVKAAASEAALRDESAPAAGSVPGAAAPPGGPERAARSAGPLPRTGEAAVDALLDRLAETDALPTEAHLAVYEDVHQGLRERLTALDRRPGPPVPARTPHER
ncbi:hypothetical protein GTW54_04495 [Streptomyces sp. SID5468]|nr:hypothetical protein [Streptomyces sp. SID5468]